MTSGNKTIGYLLGAAAAVSYGLNPTFALPLYSDGMNPDSVLILRYGLAIPMIAVMLLLRRGSFKVPVKSLLPLAGLGIVMAMSSLTLFVSYNYMDAGIASTMLFVYPIMVAVIMTIFFHEKISARTILCILLASCGIVMLYHTGGGETLSLVGTLIVMASALSYAIYLVAINCRQIKGITSLTVTFYVLVFGSLLFGGRLITGVSEFIMPSKWYLWLDACALSLFPTIISLLCTTKAIQLIGSTPTAILGALEPVTAVMMGYIFFNEDLTVREIIGIVMILFAVSFVIAGRKIFSRSFPD